MQVMTHDKFKTMPKGTIFAFGEKWAFSGLLILHEHIIIDGSENFGFYACDPMWVDGDGQNNFEILDEALMSGQSVAGETFSTKYMCYDSRPMDVFLVMDAPDIANLTSSRGT